MSTLISAAQVEAAKAQLRIDHLENASIRQLVMLINQLESDSGQSFVRMELGVPGLAPAQRAIEAEKAVLDSIKVTQYPALNGTAELREALSAYFKAFMNVEIEADNCVPTAGSMQASLATFWLVSQLHPKRKKILFLDPSFSTQMQQCRSLGIEFERVDVFDAKPRNVVGLVRERLATGEFAALLYSNPSNPVWNCLTRDELQGLGALCDEFDCIAMEDLAYFGMDFREDYSVPNQAPFPPSIRHYTDNCVLLFSGSKLFNYAGQRTGAMLVPSRIMDKNSEHLAARFGHTLFRHALLFGVIQTTTAGLCQSAQAGFEAALRAMLSGQWAPLKDARAYEQRAQKLKALMLKNGFELLYDEDNGTPIADGFYFAFGHPAYPERGLAEALLHFGVSATPLTDSGANQKQGLRACVGLMTEQDLIEIAGRLEQFAAAHG